MASAPATRDVLAEATADPLHRVMIVQINQGTYINFEQMRGDHQIHLTLGARAFRDSCIIMIVSDQAAILVNIDMYEEGAENSLPRPHMDLTDVLSVYLKNRGYFGPENHVYAMFALFQSKPSVSEPITVYRERLRNVLDVDPVSIHGFDRGESSPPGLRERQMGSACVVKERDAHPVVYIDNKDVTPNPGSMTRHLTQGSDAPTTTSQAGVLN